MADAEIDKQLAELRNEWQRDIWLTSAVIKYLNGTFPEEALVFLDGVVDDEGSISFISEIELQAWTPANPSDLLIYEQFVFNSTIIGVDNNIVN